MYIKRKENYKHKKVGWGYFFKSENKERRQALGSHMAMDYTLYGSISQHGIMFAIITLQRHTNESTYQINSWSPDKYLIELKFLSHYIVLNQYFYKNSWMTSTGKLFLKKTLTKRYACPLDKWRYEWLCFNFICLIRINCDSLMDCTVLEHYS